MIVCGENVGDLLPRVPRTNRVSLSQHQGQFPRGMSFDLRSSAAGINNFYPLALPAPPILFPFPQQTQGLGTESPLESEALCILALDP